MKKILILGLIVAFTTISASAQRGPGNRIHKYRMHQGFRSGEITRVERLHLRKDAVRLNMVQRNARRDGIVTPAERVRIHRLKADTRRDMFRFRHNGRQRVI
jgi:hypothetical protein